MTTDRPDATFVVEFHPGRPCGEWEDGSVCWSQDGAHFLVPPAPAGHFDDTAPDWDGWEDCGYIDETGGAR